MNKKVILQLIGVLTSPVSQRKGCFFDVESCKIWAEELEKAISEASENSIVVTDKYIAIKYYDEEVGIDCYSVSHKSKLDLFVGFDASLIENMTTKEIDKFIEVTFDN